MPKRLSIFLLSSNEGTMSRIVNIICINIINKTKRRINSIKRTANSKNFPPYHNIRAERRKISRDSYVSYLGNRYSVPYRFAGRDCSLQISDKSLTVIIGGDAICTHEIHQGHSRISRNKEHFQGLLSEILKQNSNPKPKFSPSFKFIEPDVEQRSLSIYDAFSEGVRK
jgi:hypothetical protein